MQHRSVPQDRGEIQEHLEESVSVKNMWESYYLNMDREGAID